MRIRFRFAKLGKIRFTSQRDVARMWERALRRAELPAGLHRGVLPPAPAQLRAGPAHRVRVPGRVPRRGPRRRRPETAAVDVAGLPARLTGLLPEGIEVRGGRPRSSAGTARCSSR